MSGSEYFGSSELTQSPKSGNCKFTQNLRTFFRFVRSVLVTICRAENWYRFCYSYRIGDSKVTMTTTSGGQMTKHQAKNRTQQEMKLKTSETRSRPFEMRSGIAYFLTMAPFLLGSAQSVLALDGVVLGNLAIAGNGCYQSPVQPELQLSSDKIEIPLSLMVKKESAASLARGACSLALPIEVDANHRLVLTEAKIVGRVNLAKGSSSLVSVEIFKAGEKGVSQVASAEAKDKRLRKDIILEQSGEIFSLACGESAILRVNSSGILKGAARATTSLRGLEIGLRLEPCQ